LYKERLVRWSPEPLTTGIALAIAGGAAAGSLILRGLLACVLAGFMMPDHAARTSPQHAVMTREVARNPTTAAPFRQPAAFAAEDIAPAVSERAKTVTIKFRFIVFPLSRE
jgi:hypothetical protein